MPGVDRAAAQFVGRPWPPYRFGVAVDVVVVAGRGEQQHGAARRYIQDGLEWVADIDVARFSGRVQFDVLMARVARKVSDRKILELIRSYPEAGVMADGVKQPAVEGTPQGSPLSPILTGHHAG
jgi:hypothetical protein